MCSLDILNLSTAANHGPSASLLSKHHVQQHACAGIGALHLTNNSSIERLFFEGNRLMAAGDLAAAEDCFRNALREAPDRAELHANLGYVMAMQGAGYEALESYACSIDLDPHIAQTHLNLGALLFDLKQLDMAEAAFTQAIQLEPESPAGWSNLGGLYASMKRDAESELCCRQALIRDSGHAKARINLANVLLRQGRFGEGWACLESRQSFAPFAAHFLCLRWNGEPLAGKSIVLAGEAGFGDIIHFARYASVIKDRGASRVTLLCPASLKALLSTVPGVDEIMAMEQDVARVGWDYWAPTMSLPLHCATDLCSIPAALPYVSAPAHQAKRWEVALSGKGVRIGLVWKGNPKFENDADRSLPGLHTLQALSQVEGVFFVSLQKGSGEQEAANPSGGLRLWDAGPQLGDFADTAALLVNLDLVISVDTAVAHLAGALNKPCWLLLPHYNTDWRWLEQRSDSPWYPGVVRLFRQWPSGDWVDVVSQVQTELVQFVQSHGKHQSQQRTT